MTNDFIALLCEHLTPKSLTSAEWRRFKEKKLWIKASAKGLKWEWRAGLLCPRRHRSILSRVLKKDDERGFMTQHLSNMQDPGCKSVILSARGNLLPVLSFVLLWGHKSFFSVAVWVCIYKRGMKVCGEIFNVICSSSCRNATLTVWSRISIIRSVQPSRLHVGSCSWLFCISVRAETSRLRRSLAQSFIITLRQQQKKKICYVKAQLVYMTCEV